MTSTGARCVRPPTRSCDLHVPCSSPPPSKAHWWWAGLGVLTNPTRGEAALPPQPSGPVAICRRSMFPACWAFSHKERLS